MKDDRPYLADILQALERVEEIGQRGREAFLADWLLQDAAIRNFEIVGEAAKRVSLALQTVHPEIPWADLAGFRDVIIHQYFRVDLESCGRSSSSGWRRCAATRLASSRRSVNQAELRRSGGAVSARWLLDAPRLRCAM